MQLSASLDWRVGIRSLTGHMTEIVVSALHHSVYFREAAEAISQIRTATLFCSVLALCFRPLNLDYGIIPLLS